MEQIVLAAYKAQLSVMEEEHKKTIAQNAPSPMRAIGREAQRKVSKEISSISEQNLRLYERYKAGEYSAEAFLEEKTKLFAREKAVWMRIWKNIQLEEEALLTEQGRVEQQAQYFRRQAGLLQLI